MGAMRLAWPALAIVALSTVDCESELVVQPADGEPACLAPGVPHPVVKPFDVFSCPATCETTGTACGTLDLGCGVTAECSCGNPDNVCVNGNCQCTPAPGDVPCAACPGRVPRFCGERNSKTQAGCDPTTSEVDGSLVWCCND